MSRREVTLIVTHNLSLSLWTQEATLRNLGTVYNMLREHDKAGGLVELGGMTWAATWSIIIPSRHFPYVRFAQFHHHQVRSTQSLFGVGKIKCFCAACTKWCGNWLVFLEKNIFRLCFHPILTENYVKFNIVWNRLCPHHLCHRIKIGKRKRGLRGTFIIISVQILSKSVRI